MVQPDECCELSGKHTNCSNDSEDDYPNAIANWRVSKAVIPFP